LLSLESSIPFKAPMWKSRVPQSVVKVIIDISDHKSIHFFALSLYKPWVRLCRIPDLCCMRPTNESSIKEVIREMLKKYELDDGLWSAKIVEAWGNSMLPAVVQRTNSINFRNGVLSVYLNSSVLKNELSMVRQDLIQQLNEALGEEVILDMQFY
jgi:hypothetical protein